MRAAARRGRHRPGRRDDDRRRAGGQPGRDRADRRGVRAPTRTASTRSRASTPGTATSRSRCSSGRFELGFKGLKLHPVSTIAHPAGEDTLRLIRVAAAHDAPTLFHCGDEPMATPLAIAPAAAACPEATIILGHMGGYFHVDEAIEVAEQHAEPRARDLGDALSGEDPRGGRALGAERVLYASDGPACSPRIEVEKVRLAGLDPGRRAARARRERAADPGGRAVIVDSLTFVGDSIFGARRARSTCSPRWSGGRRPRGRLPGQAARATTSARRTTRVAEAVAAERRAALGFARVDPLARRRRVRGARAGARRARAARPLPPPVGGDVPRSPTAVVDAVVEVARSAACR